MSDLLADFLVREQEELAGIEQPAVDHLSLLSLSENVPTQVADFPSEPQMTLSEMEDAMPVENTAISKNEVPLLPKVDSDHIVAWKLKRQALLDEKEKEEALRLKELKETAKKQLEDFYAEREERLQKAKEDNKAAVLETLENIDREQGISAEWAAIAKMCEAKAVEGGRDVTRLRGIIMGIKERNSFTA